MANRKIQIEISLIEIAPNLLSTIGEGAYLTWAKQLLEEIPENLSVIEDDPLNLTVEAKPLRGATTKGGGAILAIGTIGIILNSNLGTQEKTIKIAKALWTCLKKGLQRNTKCTSVELHIETTSSRQTVKNLKKIKISADDSEAVLALLAALKSQTPEGETLIITPQKD